MEGYTVVDVETTGFSPDNGDRVVEIGVVYVSPRGEVQDHWSTLVNPQRDVGPTKVHGLDGNPRRLSTDFRRDRPVRPAGADGEDGGRPQRSLRLPVPGERTPAIRRTA